MPTVFPLEARQIIVETRSFDRFVRRASIFPSAPPIRVRACVRASADGGAAPANIAQPRISMRTLPATYLRTSAVTFEKGSRRYESSRKISRREKERDEVAEGRGERPERVLGNGSDSFCRREIFLRIVHGVTRTRMVKLGMIS